MCPGSWSPCDGAATEWSRVDVDSTSGSWQRGCRIAGAVWF